MSNPIESKPLFEVGEVVILQSKELIRANGERSVLDVVKNGGWYVCPITGADKCNVSGHTAYILDDGLINKRGYCMQWGQRALRKRHQPSEHSFEDLKTILYLPQSRDEIARLERGMQA